MKMATRKAPTKTHSTPVKAGKRPGSSGEGKGIWSSLLDSVSSGKRLPEKRLVILGGTTESQGNFIEALSKDPEQKQIPLNRSQLRKAPIANQFALGYTYQDILDVDHDDTLARLSLYTLADYSPAFSSLLRPLFTPQSIANTLVVILLDWNSPLPWLRQLRNWVRLVRSVLETTDDECKELMEENMKDWRERRKGVFFEGSTSSTQGEGVAIPLGPGEWDEGLGVPLCLVCQNAEKTEKHEKEQGWKDEQFDYILSYMRTILLKHGASLIYTPSAAPGSLRSLVHASLGIQSLLQRSPVKHNLVDRDRILIPPNWDSWGKIRVLREAFELEDVSNAWSIDCQPLRIQKVNTDDGEGEMRVVATEKESQELDKGSAIPQYEETLQAYGQDQPNLPGEGQEDDERIESDCMDSQEFLGTQLQRLEQLQREDEQAQKAKEAKKLPGPGQMTTAGGRVNEHIGPVQFNIGGIQVDADDMLKGINDRETGRSSEENPLSSPEGKSENEKLASFFAGLVKRGGSSSPSTPKSSRD